MELSLGTKLKTFLDTCRREWLGGSIWQLQIFVAKIMLKGTFFGVTNGRCFYNFQSDWLKIVCGGHLEFAQGPKQICLRKMDQ